MKTAWLKDLQSHLLGSVTDAKDALDYFATDGSIFRIDPAGVVYPKNTHDVRQTLAFLTALAAKGHKVGLTARGKGTDQAGGALGDGLMLVMPAHLNKLVHLDKNFVTVQPGILYASLQKVLHSHGRFLPPYPSSIEFSTIGGAVANNACGEKTVKYGATRDFVRSLKVVLSNGDLIETRRISARELHRKKGQTDLEGDIYRRVDSLLIDNAKLIREAKPNTSKNAAGYALWRVKNKDGSFDLSQLIVGSQGTLGVVTEATLETLPYNRRTTLLVGFFDDLAKAGEAVLKLKPLGPSALEVVDYYLLEFLRKEKPQTIAGLVPEQLPKIALLVEFDDQSQVKQSFKSRKAGRIISRLAYQQEITTKPHEQEALWKIRRSAAAVIWMTHGAKKALPIIEDGVVPVEKLPEFLDSVYKLLNKHKLQIAVWGHAGDANFHLQPFMDLSKQSDRDKVFKLAQEFYDMVIKMGGSTCGEHNDGLMRAPYLKRLYGDEVYELFRQVKQIFDPDGILNPRVKLDVTEADVRPLVRHEYSMKHLYDHMPHT